MYRRTLIMIFFFWWKSYAAKCLTFKKNIDTYEVGLPEDGPCSGVRRICLNDEIHTDCVSNCINFLKFCSEEPIKKCLQKMFNKEKSFCEVQENMSGLDVMMFTDCDTSKMCEFKAEWLKNNSEKSFSIMHLADIMSKEHLINDCVKLKSMIENTEYFSNEKLKTEIETEEEEQNKQQEKNKSKRNTTCHSSSRKITIIICSVAIGFGLIVLFIGFAISWFLRKKKLLVTKEIQSEQQEKNLIEKKNFKKGEEIEENEEINKEEQLKLLRNNQFKI